MSTAAQQFTTEETISLLNEKARIDGDRFIVRVSRRKGITGLSENVATLAGATVLHASSPESWLPMLCGGGEFIFTAQHQTAPSTRIGGHITCNFPGQPMPVPFAGALVRGDWTGPSELVFLAGQGTPIANLTPLNSTQQQNGYIPPPLQQGGVTMVGGQGVPVMAPAQSQGDAWVRDNEARFSRREQEIREREEKIRREQGEKEEALRRLELETRLKGENEARHRELQAQIASLAKPADTGIVEKLVAALAPIAAAFIQTSAQARADALKAQLDAQERGERRAAEQAAESRKMFEAMLSKPTMTPEMQLLIETLKSQGTSAIEMARGQMEAMSMVGKQSISMIETIADINFGGQPEHPMLLALREGVSALKALQSPRKITQRPPQAPPTYQQAALSAPPGAPQSFIPPQIPVTPAPAGATTVGPQSFDGIAPQVKPANGGTAPQTAIPMASPDDDPVAILESGIRAHHNPEELGAYFVQALAHPKMKLALVAVGGDVNRLLGERLGAEWLTVPANQQYLGALGSVVDRLGKQAGLFEEEDDGDGDGDDDVYDNDEGDDPPVAEVR